MYLGSFLATTITLFYFHKAIRLLAIVVPCIPELISRAYLCRRGFSMWKTIRSIYFIIQQNFILL